MFFFQISTRFKSSNGIIYLLYLFILINNYFYSIDFIHSLYNNRKWKCSDFIYCKKFPEEITNR